MKKIISRAKNSEFLKNTATVFSGSFIAQLISILSAPFLARIYSPSDYGILGIYLAISSIVGIISTYQYHNAILIPKSDEEAFALVRLSIRNSLLSATLFAILLFAFGNTFLKLINSEPAGKWIFLIPVSALFSGFNMTFSSFATRKKFFKLVSTNRVFGSALTVCISLTLGIIYTDETGLVLGLIVGQAINGILLGFLILKASKIPMKALFNFSQLEYVRKQYIKFPKFSMPTDLLNSFTNQIPVFMINAFAGQSYTGLFNMCNRLLSMPQIFISSSIAEVFKQRASHDFHNEGTFRSIFMKTAKTLAGLSVVPFLLLLIFGPELFAFFLGEQWREAGSFARMMAPIFVLRFINSPLSYIMYLLGKLKFDLTMTVYLNVSTILILYYAFTNLSVYASIGLYALNYSLTYLFMIFKSYQFSKIRNPAHESF